MRFAYIDSQGKEVGIPSVEALQLRIELGAIGEGTMFFDANADKWGAAGEHEIFRTLTRELRARSDGTFVAPPPPAAPLQNLSPPEPPPAEPTRAAPTPAAPTPAEPTRAEPTPPEATPAGPTPDQATPDDSAPADPGRGRAPNPFEMEEGPRGPAAEDTPAIPSEPPPEPSFDLGDFGTLDLADTGGEGPEAPPAPAEPVGPEAGAGAEAGEEPASTFDFEGFGAFDLAEDEGSAPPAGEPAPADAGTPSDGEAPSGEDGEAPSGEDGEAPSGEAESGFDLGEFGALEMESPPDEEKTGSSDSGLTLEQSFAEQHAAPSNVEPDGMELEAPLSDYSAEGPPSWMMDEDPVEEPVGTGDARGGEGAGRRDREGGDGARRGSGGAGASAAFGGSEDEDHDGDGEDAPARRGPRARPAAPPRREKSRSGGLIAVLAVVALLGVGGWFGWSALSGGSGEEEVAEEPEVVIPDIDPSLLPRMRELARGAYGATLASIREMAVEHELPEEPNPDWLSGNYLGNASQFDDVEAYWTGMEEYLSDVQSSEEDLYLAHLEPLLAQPELDEAEREQIRERAVAGFQAAARDRRQVYAQFSVLAAAALDLHDFVVGNEANIEYSPARGGLSRDPVVEAVPATPQLGEEMWDRVGRIPDALDDLGALDRVTTPRLLDLLVQKLDATPIR